MITFLVVLLLSSLFLLPSARAAVVTVTPSSNVWTANSGLNNGDTMVWSAGNYNLTDYFGCKSGVIYVGKSAVISCTTPEYCWGVEANGANILITGFFFNNSAIGMTGGSLYTGISIIGNEFANVPQQYFTPAGIYIPVTNIGTRIENNYFHDINGLGANVFGGTNFIFNYNRFYNIISDGIHAGYMGDNCSMSYNCGTNIHRMGIEWQYSAYSNRGPANVLVTGNVFSHFIQGYWDTFGLSIVPDPGENTTITNNYLKGDYDQFLNGTTRLGYGIEVMFSTGTVANNVIGGAFWVYICCATLPISTTYNRFYGVPADSGSYASGETGGSCVDPNNTNKVVSTDFSQMPPVPNCPVYPGEAVVNWPEWDENGRMRIN